YTSRMPQPWLLVVDDEPDIRESLCEVLSAEGFAVSTAAEGREALQLMRSRRPDAVLLDLRMPRVSGWNVLATMRQTPSLARIPTVVVTADATSPSFGATARIQKPVRTDALVRAIRDAMGKVAAR